MASKCCLSLFHNSHHWSKRFPTYEGMSSFTGEAIHSKDYKKPSQACFCQCNQVQIFIIIIITDLMHRFSLQGSVSWL